MATELVFGIVRSDAGVVIEALGSAGADWPATEMTVAVGDVVERLEGVTPSRIVPRRAEAMADALCELLHLHTRSNGREKVLDLGIEKIAARVKEVYEEVSKH